MRGPFGNFQRDFVLRNLAFMFAFLALGLSACGPPKNVIVLYQEHPVYDLVWSPSGDELAITAIFEVADIHSRKPSVYTIDVVNIKTRKVRLVVSQDFGDGLSPQGWTSDGKQLAFSGFSYKDNKEGIWLADLNGIDPPKLVDGDIALAGSPAGEMVIVRNDNTTQKWSLYLRNTGTNSETLIFSDIGVEINSVFWSSDGSKLVFGFQKREGNEATKGSIYIFDPSTKSTTQVIPDQDVWDPSLSPDGKLIAYRKWDPNHGWLPEYLHIMKSDGSCDVEVSGHFDVFSPTWSPNGKYIAYIGKDEGVYLVDLLGVFGKDIVAQGLPCP